MALRPPWLPLALLLTLGCRAAFGPAPSRWPRLPDGHFMAVGDFLQVTGVARPDPQLKLETQRKSDSRDRALLDAWERLRSYLEGLALPEGGTVGDRASGSEEWDRKLDALARSAEPVSTKWEPDGTAAVVVRIERGRLNRSLGTEFQ